MESGVFFEEESSGFAAIYAIYKAGGLFEKKGFRGISHLAEHLKCKKEKEFRKVINIYNIETNAFTDDDCVCFYCRSGDLEIARFARDYVKECLSYVPTEKEFEEEKSIILQEYDSFINDYNIQIRANREIFGYDGPIGSREDIEAITYKKFKMFYVEHFSKPTCVVFVGGKSVKHLFSSLHWEIEVCEPDVKERVLSAKFVNKTVTSEVKRQSDFQILLSKINRKNCGFTELSLRFFANLMSDGFFSPLIENIREKHGLCYWLGYSVEVGKELCIYLQTETKQWKKMKEVYFDILNRFEEYVSKEVYDDYLIKIMTKFNHMRMKPSEHEFILRKYVKTVSLFRDFDPEEEDYSYETMKKIASYLTKKAGRQTIVHHGNRITFSAK